MIPDSTAPLHLGVMAKYWEAGRVKTRLGRSIGMDHAASLHRAFCCHLAETLSQSGGRRSFVITPPEKRPEFESMAGPDWQIDYQAEGDLGHRMRAWFAEAENENRVLIGADCPLLDDSVLCAAGAELAHHDVVFGPAIDGGYYLVGLRGPWRSPYADVFDGIPWSTDAVLSDSCRRASEAGLSVAVLDPREDVDTVEELVRLRGRLTAMASDQTDGERFTRLLRLVEATL